MSAHESSYRIPDGSGTRKTRRVNSRQEEEEENAAGDTVGRNRVRLDRRDNKAEILEQFSTC